MAKKNTKKMIFLTSNGEYVTNDKDIMISSQEIVCCIDASDCDKNDIQKMQTVISDAKWDSFCAVCEHITPFFTVSEITRFIPHMNEHYVLLSGIQTEVELGRYWYNRFHDFFWNELEPSNSYFESIGQDLVKRREAVKTSYGYLLIFW